ncbi:MAG: formylglycine-generating enzyme family protein [Chloroflexaceae bacterium]|nr:formylglycine-generating enzyme family protein [Chloroflexaceae bacterium]
MMDDKAQRQLVQPAPAQPALYPGQRPAWLPEMIEIPAGPFLMGSSDMAGNNEKPQHQLELPTYSISKTPITNAQFRPFVEGDGYTNRDYWTEHGWQWRQQEERVQPHHWKHGKWNGADYPVVGVSWFEAVAYCRWLSAQTGREYRLPTEAEWEKAARGSNGYIWPWGNEWGNNTYGIIARIWFKRSRQPERCNSEEDGQGRTTPVGSYPNGASPYGLLDMAGNVNEWCATHWRKDYPYQISDEWSTEYLEQRGLKDKTVVRGGCYWQELEYVRGASRNFFSASYDSWNDSIGVRVASSAPL